MFEERISKEQVRMRKDIKSKDEKAEFLVREIKEFRNEVRTMTHELKLKDKKFQQLEDLFIKTLSQMKEEFNVQFQKNTAAIAEFRPEIDKIMIDCQRAVSQSDRSQKHLSDLNLRNSKIDNELYVMNADIM